MEKIIHIAKPNDWDTRLGLAGFGLVCRRCSSNSNNMWQRCIKLSCNINNCALMDLGFTRASFTRFNGRQGNANTMEHLDHALTNSIFPESLITALPRVYSDHCPSLVNLEGISPRNQTFSCGVCCLKPRNLPT